MDIWITGLPETNLPEMTFSGAVLIIVTVLARAVFLNRLPKKTFLALWGIVLLRLLLPVSISSGFSVYSLILETESDLQDGAGQEQDPSAAQRLSQSLPSAAEPEQDLSTVEKLRQRLSRESRDMPAAIHWLHDLSALYSSTSAFGRYAYGRFWFVWAAGCMAGLCMFAVFYVKCRRKFAESLPVENDFAARWIRQHKIQRTIQIRQSDRIKAPLTYGLFHPVILMPKYTDWENERQLLYIFTHEYIHIRRFDMVTKILLAAAVSVHWFNPLVWCMYVLCNRDLELSCDETVVRLTGHGARAEYAHVLIRMEEHKCAHAPLCSSFSRYAVEERITAIMKNKKVTLMTGILAASLVAGISIAFATSAAASHKEDTARPVTGSAVEINVKDQETHVTEEPYLISKDEKFKEYEKYGLSYDKKSGYLMYKGKKVGYFKDEWSDQTYTRYVDLTGEIGVIVMRDKDYKITGLQEAQIPYTIEDGSDITAQETNAEPSVIGDVYYAAEDGSDIVEQETNAEPIIGDVYYAAEDGSDIVEQTTDNMYAEETGGEESGISKEYEKYGISSETAGWMYKGKKIAGLYDHTICIYTSDHAPKERVVYLEVLRSEDGKISGIKEITKEEMQKLVDNMN